jgi:3-hydroxyacyl-[acyl-carrier-protein] dehydratase
LRFLFVDKILELERGRRILAAKTATMMDEYFTAHYQRTPVMPPTLLLEAMLQAGGWLNLISRDFRAKAIVALVEEVHFHREVRSGERLLLEAHVLYTHSDGATMRAETRVGSELVAVADGIVLAHEMTSDEAFIRTQTERFHYLSGGLPLP